MTARTQTEQQFYQDAPVYDTSGEKVGALHAYDPEGGYITVQKGFLFHKDLYIPLTAVQGTDADGNIHLSLHKDDLADERYNDPPAAGMASSAAGEDSYAQRTTVADTTTTTRMQAAPAPRPAPAPRQAPPVAPADDTIAVPVYEEQLTVGKRQEEVGQVHLHKEVVQERATANVSLRHEEVTVERVPFTGQASEADLQNAFQDQVIAIPVMGEEAVVGKQTHVVEEVRLHKDAVQEQQQVTGTVRKERVTVDEVDTTRDQGGTSRRP